eukprot:15121070-Alexandrium_andersonii.AAC.1
MVPRLILAVRSLVGDLAVVAVDTAASCAVGNTCILHQLGVRRHPHDDDLVDVLALPGLVPGDAVGLVLHGLAQDLPVPSTAERA